MSTNYYAKILPNQAEKEILKLAIDTNNEYLVKELVDLYYNVRDSEHQDRKIIHLGKRSAGWKFLWDTNYFPFIDIKVDGEGNKKAIKVLRKTAYELNKESILKYLQQDNLLILDEYCNKIKLSEFIEIAFSDSGLDEESYRKSHQTSELSLNLRSNQEQKLWEELGVSFTSNMSTEFISDGLRFSTCEFS